MISDDKISLREYIDVLMAEQKNAVSIALVAQEKAVAAALAAADRAVTKAESATERRLESMNEFRQALSDAGRLQMPRSEAEQVFKGFDEKLDTLTARVNARYDQTKGGGNVVSWLALIIGMIVGVGGLAIAILR